MNAAVTAVNLTVRRGKQEVLRDLTFTVRAGTVTGLLGPSGSGKTTLIRAVVGVQVVHGGTVEVLGQPAGSRQLRHQVRYVTQSPSVYGDLTVAENLRYFAQVYDLGASEERRAIEEVHLGATVKQLVRDLSGGQRARVSLACAILGDPDVLILDEPTVGLDPVLREDIWATFHRKAAAGTTLLVSSHVMDEAGRCDRLLFIRDGSIIADDTPAALRQSTGQTDLEQAFLHLVGTKEVNR